MKQYDNPIRICIIGCGFQVEQAYLPILTRMNACKVESLIDIDLSRCRALAKHYNIDHYSSTIDDIPSTVEAAIVALPHYLHSSVSCDLMKKRLHVFCEKPMATTRVEAEAMVRCARDYAVSLSIGNIFRFYWTSRHIKEIIESKKLGALVSFHIEDGKLFDWPTSSGFYFDRRQSGGGVLIDTGAHVLDLLLWWLQEYPTVVKYQDDNFGGVEAECLLKLDFSTSIYGSLKFSRLSKLQNKYRLTFEHGIVEFQPYDPSGICNTITVYRNNQKIRIKSKKVLGYLDYFKEQMEVFVHSVKAKTPPVVSGASVIPSIQLIEECYQNADRLVLPWLHLQAPRHGVSSRIDHGIDQNLKVLITGASGFIGGRIAERLYVDYHNIPRCLIRNFNKLSRLSRFPIETSVGNVLDYNSLSKAMAGCDVVIHAAYGNTPDDDLNVKINTLGTKNVIHAALQHGVKKFIYLSTIEVYGKNQHAIITEQTETSYSDNSYGNSKLDAENLCLKYFNDSSLPVVILRLAVVYGPYAPIWTVDVINRLLDRGFCLSDTFNGLCNLIYIDDCIDAIFLAIANNNIMGETFLISGGEGITWNEYFSKYNEILNLPPLKN
jgi:predicted dehydrogenase/nucleoside-diphosphate-sugar epimerase